MKDKLVLVGGGGHCKACIEVADASDKFLIAGVIDPRLTVGSSVLNYTVLGDDRLIASYAEEPQVYFLITVGHIHSPNVRIQLSQQIMQAGGKMATVESPTAIVSKESTIGAGSIVMHHTIINSNCQIGVQAILNNKSLVEHDCTIGDYCHISTAAVINGNCTIGNRVFVGSSAVLVNGISVTDDVIIGAGAVVHRSITEAGVYVGNPARNVSKKNA